MPAAKVHFALLCLVMMALPTFAEQPQSSSTSTPDAFARKWLEAWNSHDVDRILTFYTEDAVYEDVPTVENRWGVPSRGHQMIRESLAKTFEDMPDLGFELVSASGTGDRMLVEWTMTGTHYRDQTGRFSIRAVSVIKRKGDKIASVRDYYDAYLLLSQLGMVPAIAQSKSTIERNKELVLTMNHEVWNEGNLAAIDELFSPGFVQHFLPDGSDSKGIDALREHVKEHREAFPDWGEKIVQIVAEKDLVVIRFESSGTNLGSWLGNPPTGKKVHINEFSILRVEDGKIAEQWLMPDLFSLRRQLGLDGQ